MKNKFKAFGAWASSRKGELIRDGLIVVGAITAIVVTNIVSKSIQAGDNITDEDDSSDLSDE